MIIYRHHARSATAARRGGVHADRENDATVFPGDPRGPAAARDGSIRAAANVLQSPADSCRLQSGSYLSGLSCLGTTHFSVACGQCLPPRKAPRTRRQPCLPPHTASFHEYSAVTQLFVGNLPFTATEETVRALFATHGTVEKVALIDDRETGRPRGFGFVEMPNDDASRAMQALNGADFDGRSLKVNEAQDRERSGGGGNRSGGSRRY